MMETTVERSINEDWMTVEAIGKHESEEHTWRTVPEECDLITVGVDVHGFERRALYFQVDAWDRNTGDRFLVEYGTEDLFLSKSDRDLPGNERCNREATEIVRALDWLSINLQVGWERRGTRETVHPNMVGIDIRYRDDVVLPWLHRRGRGWIGIEGEGRHSMKSLQKLERPKGGYAYWRLDVNRLKHVARELFAVPPGQNGYYHLPGDRDLSGWKRHQCSEQYVLKEGPTGHPQGRWHLTGKNNDWWDTNVYSTWLAMTRGVPVAE